MRSFGIACACLGLFALVSVAPAEDKKPAPPQGGPTPEMMAKMQAAITPGEQHKKLAELVGTFDCTMTCWMPGAPEPMVSKGVNKNEMILDGRWLKGDFVGEMMGQKYTGIGLLGYDNAAKMYVGSYIDSMSTMMSQHTGQADASGNIITLHAENIDCMTGQKAKMRMVFNLTNKDRYTFEFFMPGADGKEIKAMEIIYTRAK